MDWISDWQGLGAWFWSDEFWLPANVTWKHLQTDGGVGGGGGGGGGGLRAGFNDLLYPLAMACLLTAARKATEKVIFRPAAHFLGLSMKQKQHERRKQRVARIDEELRQELMTSGHKSPAEVSQKEVDKWSEKLNVPKSYVNRWLLGQGRFPAKVAKPTLVDKFSETGWRFVYYSLILAFGMYCLSGKAWLWDIQDCWLDYPGYRIERDVWWYYMLELSFYWSLLLSHFTDVRRKDFWVMLVHHVVTILLMTLSWTCNFVKVGTLVLLIHDTSDVLMESAKLCKYAGRTKVAELLFGSFAVTWIVSRLLIFPYWIMYSVMVQAPARMHYFPAFYLFNGLLGLLMMLNIGWSYFILKVVYQAVNKRASIANDARSESESSSSAASEHHHHKD